MPAKNEVRNAMVKVRNAMVKCNEKAKFKLAMQC